MKKRVTKICGLLLAVLLMVSIFAGCGGKAEVESPVAAKVKTDLHDAEFTFTYGQLREVIPGDKLAQLFETTNKKTDDKTRTMSYQEIVSMFGREEYFDDLMNLATEEEMAALTANQEQVLDYFNGLINDIKATAAPKVSYSENFWITHDDEVVFRDKNGNELEGQDMFKAAFRLYADTALKNIGDFLMNRSQDEALESGSDLTDILYLLGSDKASLLTLDDLYTAEKIYPVYSSVTSKMVNVLDEKGNNLEDGDGEYIYVPTEPCRTIVINVKPEEDCVKKAFSIREKEGIMDELKKAEGYLTVNSFDIGFAPCKITASIDAETDLMTYVTYEKNMIITADITFTGALAQYGNVIVEFPCTSSLTYDFGWQAEAE